MPLAKPRCFSIAGLTVICALASDVGRASDEQPPVEPKLTIVNVASHCDWAWVHTRAWHENRYADMIHDYLLLMRDNPKLVWQLETVNEQLLPFLTKAEQQWPGMIDEFWQRVKEGRIEVVSGYSNPRLSEVYPELFVRSLVLGKEYFRRHVPGIRQDVFEAPDLMCGTSQVPQILSLAGYRYFMFTRPVSQQAVFWRKGLDGTRMIFCKDVYGYPELQGKPGAAFPGINALPLWRYAIGCDDMPPTQETVNLAIDGESDKKMIGTMRRFFEECEKYSDRMTELSGPLDSCNYYNNAGLHGCDNIYMQNNRNEDVLLVLEKAQAMASMLDRSFYSEPVDGLWQDALSSVGHAIEWIWKEDYAERMAKGRHTREKASRFTEDALAAIASGIPFAAERGSPLVVFNIHEWPVSGLVQVSFDGDCEGLALSDSEGRDVPLQLLSEKAPARSVLAFNAMSVPACGFKTYYLRRAKDGGMTVAGKTHIRNGDAADKRSIENEFYRITLLQDGHLDVFDKSRGVALGELQTGGLGDLAVYDMPPSGDSWMHNGPPGTRRDWQPSAVGCGVEQGPVFASIGVPGTIGKHAICREFRLTKGSRCIEFGVFLDTATPDNGIFCIRFPLGLSGKVVAGIPFGVESRDHLDKEIFRGENFCLGFPEGYDGARWTDVSDNESAKFGYTFVCPQGMHTGYAFKMKERTIEFILDRFQPMPKDNFVRAAASISGTGSHQWWCALVPHPGDWGDAKSYRAALEQHVPLMAWSPAAGLNGGGVPPVADMNKPERPKTDGPLPAGVKPAADASLVEVQPGNVVLSAMRLVREKPGDPPAIEMRLYETTGSAADVTIRLARPAATVAATNFLGEPLPQGPEIKIAGNEIHFHIEPWKIVNLRIKMP
jgi:alpha-mannosidase